MSWNSIDIPIAELCLDTVLRSGQSFRWTQSAPLEYSCAIHGRLITLKQDETKLYYRAIFPSTVDSESTAPAAIPIVPRTASDLEEFKLQETQRFLRHYLNLEPNLGAQYTQWSERDKNFAKKAPTFHKVRILKQDAWETLVGFICSSCNNIKRISQMMDKLCANYGPLIGHINDVPYYDMPPPAALVNPRVEAHLRELGFGYRAAYLFQTAQMIAREKEGWLDSLRNPENPVFGRKASPAGQMQPEGREGYRNAHTALVKLQGVGPKVADCVCLFGLGWGEAVPVDTHIWQIAQRDYGFGKGKHTSLTKATYDTVANYFRQLWGKEAGWAHSILFTADLKTFAEKTTADIVKSEEILGSVKSEEILDFVKAETNEESTVIYGTATGRTLLSSPPADNASVSIKEETIILDNGDASNLALNVSVVNTQTSSIKDEIKHEVEEDVMNTAIVKEEDDNPILKREMVETAAPIRSNKRSANGHVKQERIDVKTELVEQPVKRRRSDRLLRR